MKSLYIHIPFCKQKCIYCGFNSYCNKNDLVDDYIDALKKEIIDLNEKSFNTIYFGGGTPSYIDATKIAQIMDLVSSDAEVTLELNPGTITKEKLMIYKSAGINRLSIGLQVYDDELLKVIGRIHTKDEFDEAYRLAREAGFENISVDLMIGLPRQKLIDVDNSLNHIISLNPEHISCYSLIMHEELENRYTKPFKEELPEDAEERKMYYLVCDKLKEAGYIQYEISNFAKKGFYSRHNLCYWNQNEYYGVGAGASSYIDNIRYKNVDSIEEYIKDFKNTRIVEEKQNEENKLKEYMILKLRLLDGVDLKEAQNIFKIDILKKFEKEIKKLEKMELIYIINEDDTLKLKLTKKGLDFANVVWEEFI